MKKLTLILMALVMLGGCQQIEPQFSPNILEARAAEARLKVAKAKDAQEEKEISLCMAKQFSKAEITAEGAKIAKQFKNSKSSFEFFKNDELAILWGSAKKRVPIYYACLPSPESDPKPTFAEFKKEVRFDDFFPNAPIFSRSDGFARCMASKISKKDINKRGAWIAKQFTASKTSFDFFHRDLYQIFGAYVLTGLGPYDYCTSGEGRGLFKVFGK